MNQKQKSLENYSSDLIQRKMTNTKGDLTNLVENRYNDLKHEFASIDREVTRLQKEHTGKQVKQIKPEIMTALPPRIQTADLTPTVRITDIFSN